MNCECGIHPSDPIHLGWHNIIMHNRYVFEKEREKREKEFDELLKRNGTPGRQTRPVPPVQRREDTLWDE